MRVIGAGEASWIMPNANAQGYYRFNLPVEMWSSLIDAFGQLRVGEQLAIVDSAFAMFEAGDLDADVLKRVIAASAQAEDRRVISAPMTSLTRIVQMLEGDDRKDVQSHLMSLYEDRLRQARRQNGVETRLLDGALTGFLAFSAEAPSYREETIDRAKSFLGIGQPARADALLADEYWDAFTLLIQVGGEDEYLALAAEIESRDDASFEMAAISALGTTRNLELAAAARQSILDGSFGARESFNLMANQMAEPAIREEAWLWLQENYLAFVERIPRQWRRRTPSLFESFCDVSRLSELNVLFELQGSLAPGYEGSLAQTQERIQLCSAIKASKVSAFVEAIRAAP